MSARERQIPTYAVDDALAEMALMGGATKRCVSGHTGLAFAMLRVGEGFYVQA